MTGGALCAVILAAGEGKRMRSSLPKVMHPVGGLPMILHVLRTTRAAGVERLVVVVGHGRELVERAVASEGVEVVVQAEQLGTGHAVRMVEPLLGGRPGNVLILSGDVPLIRASSLAEFLADHLRADRAATVMTAEASEPGMLGRVVRDARGHLQAIVEVRDATPQELAIREINTGIYCFALKELWPALRELDRANAQEEYYLTDTVRILGRQGKEVGAWRVADEREVMGVNTPEELETTDRIYRSWAAGQVAER